MTAREQERCRNYLNSGPTRLLRDTFPRQAPSIGLCGGVARVPKADGVFPCIAGTRSRPKPGVTCKQFRYAVLSQYRRTQQARQASEFSGCSNAMPPFFVDYTEASVYAIGNVTGENPRPVGRGNNSIRRHPRIAQDRTWTWCLKKSLR